MSGLTPIGCFSSSAAAAAVPEKENAVRALKAKKDKMDLCRKLLNCTQYLSKLRNKTVAEKLQMLYQKDICKCEKCGGKLLSFRLRGSYSLTG